MHRAFLHDIDDTRIREIKELRPPSHVLREFPPSERTARTTVETRQAMAQMALDNIIAFAEGHAPPQKVN